MRSSQNTSFHATMQRITLKAMAVGVIVGIAAGIVAVGHADGTPAEGEPQIGNWGVPMEHVDRSVDPGDDFFAYVTGKWMAQAEIPADLPSWGAGIELHLKAEEDVRDIITDLAQSDPAPGSVGQKVGDLYASWMDVDRLDQLGAAPLRPHLQQIATIDSHEDLSAAFASVHATAPFGVGILPDPADTTRYIAAVGQAGLGLPGRDYYLDQGATYQGYRAAYRDYIETLFDLAGMDESEARAERILALETRLAEAHWPPEDSRNIQKVYNPMSQQQLAELVPQLDWQLIFERLGLAELETFIVTETTALEKSGRIVVDTPVQTWRDYLAFHFISDQASFLSTAFDRAKFELNRALSGVEEQRERAKRGVQLINGVMGEAVGQVYVQRQFPPQAKARVEELVGHLVAAFRERLRRNHWMDEATRTQALAKLDRFEPRVGYPEKWTDYSSLDIERDDLFGNRLELTDFHWQQQLDRLDGPVDRALWSMSPQTVNAYYNPLMNQITFPAAILQPPMFDPAADPAVNYGAIGAVIGHEIGHGFDDQGRRFDEAGRIRDWWSAGANEQFLELAAKLGAQYAAYEPVPGTHINSELTMGENIGDLGGMEMAYAAYHRYLEDCCDGKAPVIDGLTGDQRFFLGYAAAWRRIQRDDFARKQLKSDPHSPPKYRVNGVVRNMDAWYEAFDVAPGDDLYLPPSERVRIW